MAKFTYRLFSSRKMFMRGIPFFIGEGEVPIYSGDDVPGFLGSFHTTACYAQTLVSGGDVLYFRKRGAYAPWVHDQALAQTYSIDCSV